MNADAALRAATLIKDARQSRATIFPFYILHSAFYILLVLALGQRVSANIIDRILAVVSGEMITLSDVETAIVFGFVETKEGPDPIGSAVEELVQYRLILAEVNRYAPPEPEDKAIQARLEAIKRRVGDDQRYAAALRATGMTEDRLRVLIRNRLRQEAYLVQRFPADARRGELMAEWIEGLRRRAVITIRPRDASQAPRR